MHHHIMLVYDTVHIHGGYCTTLKITMQSSNTGEVLI